MMPRVTIITVVRNDKQHIGETIVSALAQTGVEVQYLVLDGASTDGTADIIRSFENQLSYWHSSPDRGMYDAMNQAIKMADGEWISILNSGDTYVSSTSLADAIAQADTESSVIFGHSIEVNPEWNHEIRALPDTSLLRFAPTFRHGSALIRSEVHKAHLFDLSQEKRLGYALDWEMLHQLWQEGYKFQMVDTFIEAYRAEGTSNHPYRNLLYNYRITSQGVSNKLPFIKYFCSRLAQEFLYLQFLTKSYPRIYGQLDHPAYPLLVVAQMPFAPCRHEDWRRQFHNEKKLFYECQSNLYWKA